MESTAVGCSELVLGWIERSEHSGGESPHCTAAETLTCSIAFLNNFDSRGFIFHVDCDLSLMSTVSGT